VGSFGTVCWQIFGQLVGRFLDSLLAEFVDRFVGQPVGLFWTCVFSLFSHLFG
jgi:hypothetical protein